MKSVLTLFFTFLTLAMLAAGKPYSETADAKLEIQQALAQAATNQTPIIVIFGANWCPDCRMLDRTLKSDSSAASFLHEFAIVKVNVGHFDKNLDLAQLYGIPLKKGVPAAVILSPKNEVIYVTKDGEIENARKMGKQGIYDFFKRVTAGYHSKK